MILISVIKSIAPCPLPLVSLSPPSGEKSRIYSGYNIVILRILRALRGIMQISVIVHEHVHLLTRLARQPNRYDLMRER